MFDSEWLRAMPIGLILLLGTVFAAWRRRSGRDRAARQLPELAERLGLDFKAPNYKGAIGKLVGEMSGLRVWVDPDEAARVRVYFATPVPVSLRTYTHKERPPHGMEVFTAEDAHFNHFFKERYAAPEFADLAFDQPGLGSSVTSIEQVARGHIKEMAVTADGIDCQLDYQKPAYIPAELLEPLLKHLVSLALTLQSVA